MVVPRVLAAIVVSMALTGAQNTRAADDRGGPELQAAEPQLLGLQIPPSPENLAPIEVRATESSLHEIATWLSANFELPYADELPRIERVTPLRLQQMRYRPLLTPQGGEPATTTFGHQREVVALYDVAARIIYLPDTWTGASAAEQSVLVHEMVHHLQNLAHLTFACGGEREKPAYLAQDRWLKQHGLELEKEFDVDMFTIVAMSACMG